MIHIWTGISGTGKTTHMFEEIIKKTEKEPLGNKIFIITPTQNTLTYESMLINPHESTYSGSLRTSVLSFSRFMWHILNEIGAGNRDTLTESGHIMLIHKLIESFDEDELKYYRDSKNHVKFSGKVLDMIEEFVNYEVDIETLESIKWPNNRMAEKYADLVKIYKKWQYTILEHNIEKMNAMPDFVDRLAKLSPNEVPSLRNATIYIDGFHNFSEVEYRFLKVLNKFTDDIHLILLQDGNNKSLFRKTNAVIDRLQMLDMFTESGTEIIKFDERNLRANKQGLIDVESFLYEGSFIRDYDGITIIEAENPREEITEVARQIESLVRDKHATYNDIGVLYRDDTYARQIEHTFNKFNIYYHIDEKYKMNRHPFAQFILSLFNAYSRNLERTTVINIMKSGYLNEITDKNSMYLFENIVLERGINYTRLHDDDVFKTQFEVTDDGRILEIDEETNENLEALLKYKNRILNVLTSLFKGWNNATTVKEYLEILYYFLENNGVLEKISNEINEHDESVRRINETEEVYKHIIALMDQSYLVYKDEEKSFESFMSTFTEGLNEAEFSMRPSTLEEVIVGKIELAKVENKKYVFIVGMNHTAMPMDMSTNHILTDDEKRIFEEKNIQLSPTSDTLREDERFVFYHGLTRPTDGLYISFSNVSISGERTTISPFVKEILDSNEKRTNLKYIETTKYQTKDIFSQLSSESSMRDLLHMNLRKMMKESYDDLVELENVPNYLPFLEALSLLKEKNNETYLSLKRTLKYSNQASRLSKDVAQQLYGDSLKTSVSRFQTFYNCQFKHFAQYGLKLNPRKPFEVRPLEIGNLYHNVLEDVIGKRLNKTLVGQTDETIRKEVDLSVEKIVEKISYGIFETNAYYQSLKIRAAKTISETIINLRRYLENSDFNIEIIEGTFGEEYSDFGELQFVSDAGHQINLRGKIDRVDIKRDGPFSYISLIDYKSNATKDLNLKEIYVGKELQQFTYMRVLLENGHKKISGELIPLLMHFYPVVNPTVTLTDIENQRARDMSDEEFAEFIQKKKEAQLRPNGKFVADLHDSEMESLNVGSPGLVELLNGEQKITDFYRLQVNKEGGFYKTDLSKIISTDGYKRIEAYTINKIRDGADLLYSGKVDINPLTVNEILSPCAFCEFKAACNIDYLMNKRDFVEMNSVEVEEEARNLMEGVQE
ncbi:PD-(D/E)XK nuclease family protein [Phocicoccus pinnipedialis]|uniref:ATP-dependent helicase/deoxyribonuclease subunit B n=1 Tax=Phocicoccus pinnipedialis TaxID=110845 RepID=A0A6V7R8C4_9BACL|nr:PD-(D/E)XK nuclease family protein [Jeotgalicoccus pinnipedialis]MBP1938896.1 ATP-dependent helicase/nuclease subunit B [Jeotgalicoccus pinnipedialis]CAD2073264.1 ATP-dependent helicase/deoxyribonuclease subunit B [Jeotgalicoccus pinnipedialis]